MFASRIETRFLLRIAQVGALLAAALLALTVWSPNSFPVDRWLYSLLQYDANYQEGLIHPSMQELRHALWRNEMFAAGCLLLFAYGSYFRVRILRWCATVKALELVVWLACTAAIFVPLMNYGHEGDFRRSPR